MTIFISIIFLHLSVWNNLPVELSWTISTTSQDVPVLLHIVTLCLIAPCMSTLAYFLESTVISGLKIVLLSVSQLCRISSVFL